MSETKTVATDGCTLAWSFLGEKHAINIRLRRKIGHGLFGKICAAHPESFSFTKDKKRLRFSSDVGTELIFDGSLISIEGCQTVESARHCLARFLEDVAGLVGGFGWLLDFLHDFKDFDGARQIATIHDVKKCYVVASQIVARHLISRVNPPEYSFQLTHKKAAKKPTDNKAALIRPGQFRYSKPASQTSTTVLDVAGLLSFFNETEYFLSRFAETNKDYGMLIFKWARFLEPVLLRVWSQSETLQLTRDLRARNWDAASSKLAWLRQHCFLINRTCVVDFIEDSAFGLKLHIMVNGKMQQTTWKFTADATMTFSNVPDSITAHRLAQLLSPIVLQFTSRVTASETIRPPPSYGTTPAERLEKEQQPSARTSRVGAQSTLYHPLSDL
jgi:hypothetical protein